MNNPYASLENTNTNGEIDLDMSNYNLQDVLNIFDIPLKSLITNSEEEVYEMIESKIDGVILKFKNLNLIKFVEFFENMKATFLVKGNEGNLAIQSEENSVVDNAASSDYQLYNPNDVFKNEYVQNQTLPTTNIGNLNPLSRKYVQKLINVDSKYRKSYDTYTSTNFVVELPAKINNVIEMKLNELEMVNTFYVISDEYENNHFWIKFTTVNGSYFYMFVFLDPQAYFEEHILKELNQRFKELGLSIAVTVDVTRETFRQIPEGTGKLSFIITDPRIVYAEFHFESASLPNFKESTIYNQNYDQHQFVYVSKLYNKKIDEEEFLRIDILDSVYSDDEVESIYNNTTLKQLTHKLGWMAGFRSNIVTINVTHMDDGTAYGKVESEAVVNFSGPKYFFLYVNDYNNNFNTNLYTTDDRGIVQSNTFARINRSGDLFFDVSSNSNYQITTIPRHYFGPVTIEKLEIKLFDEFGNIINLNGNDISMTFTVTSMYSQMDNTENSLN